MKIAIIGAGFTGLSAAYTLLKEGHTVTVFEKDAQPGGLAIGYQEKEWEWTLEKHYHHWFTNDSYVLSLAKEIGHSVTSPRPKTSVLIDETMYQLDSPMNLLRFPALPMLDKLRMASVLAFLRYNPYWKPLESIYAKPFLRKTMGEKGYSMIWDPQFSNKFGEYRDQISLAWFWARIKKRTPSLAYPEGGFLRFAEHLVAKITEMGGTVHFNATVQTLQDTQTTHLTVHHDDKSTKKYDFDKTIVTLPSFLFVKSTPQLLDEYKNKLARLKGLGATNLVLRLKKPFFRNNTYWLSVCNANSPIMAIVEHTNFQDKTHYNNEHIVYLGNYVPQDHPYFAMDEKQMLSAFDPVLKKLNPTYKENLIGMKLFKAPFAQPIIPVNYSKVLPDMVTPLPNVYLANIEQVYPWDRGTNYAVELGEKVASLVANS